MRNHNSSAKALIPETDDRSRFQEGFRLASAAKTMQGIKKGPRANGKGPFQLVCEDCGAHGQSDQGRTDHLWWHFPDALSYRDIERMITDGPTHKIVGCGICGSHKLKGILFAEPLI